MGKEKKEKRDRKEKRRKEKRRRRLSSSDSSSEDEEYKRRKAEKLVGDAGGISQHACAQPRQAPSGAVRRCAELQWHGGRVEQWQAPAAHTAAQPKPHWRYAGLQAKKVARHLQKHGTGGHGYTNEDNPFNDAAVR